MQSTSFAKLEMIPQKLDNFHKLLSHNKTSGLCLSSTVHHEHNEYQEYEDFFLILLYYLSDTYTWGPLHSFK